MEASQTQATSAAEAQPARPEAPSDAEVVADLKRVFALQQAHRWVMARTTPEERIQRLTRLRKSILAHRAELGQAVHDDFRKHDTEFDLTEIQLVLQELQHTTAHLAEWLEPRAVKTPFILFGTRSELRYEPKGVVAILSPWNYPFQLMMAPLIAAIASGNCAILRPSEKTANTSRVMKKIVEESFDEREVALFTGGIEVADAILELPFDHFFFTGSTRVGKKVMARAAEHLASVTLELGGKSPCIVDEAADVKAAAERVVWGKLVNAGQTCVAPDYVLVHEKVKDAFLDAARAAVERAYGSSEEARRQSRDLARIIDDGAFKRLQGLFEETVAMGARVEIGGQFDAGERYVSPTILSAVSPAAPVMKEEIFGPILPVITVASLDEAYSVIRREGKPLALYIFSRNQKHIDDILLNTTSGGTTVNNVLLHLANPNLPFGGVGPSGQGSYHGEAGIRAFSHERAVLHQGRIATLKLLQPPYTARTKKLVGVLNKLFT